MEQSTAVQQYMPALTIAESTGRYNALVEFVKTVMQTGRDFGVIPGTAKPTLLKPGAEKLCTLFGLKPEFECFDSVKDWDKGFFYFAYRCTLRRGGEVIATGEGSCNSREKKYRWRYVPEFAATDDEKARAARREQKTGRGGRTYTMLVIENSEPFDLVNTLQKMAQKRALIAATLIGVNASEFFTQDVEDMQAIEGEFREVTETAAMRAETEQPKQQNGHSEPAGDAQEKMAVVKTGKWPQAAAQIARDIPHYANKDGKPNFVHILRAVAACGFSEVTDANLEPVIEALANRAKEQAATN